MNPFFEELGQRFADEAKRGGVTIEPPKLEPKTAEELLQLASVVAHTRERKFAPLACFLAGVAAGRALAQNTRLDVTEFIKHVRLECEPQEDSSGKTG